MLVGYSFERKCVIGLVNWKVRNNLFCVLSVTENVSLIGAQVRTD